MPIDEISTVCYVGAGTMGCYNSLAAAISGYKVVLYDVDERTLAQIPERQREMAALLVGGGYCSADDIPGALRRVSVVDDLIAATANADLVSESVFERLDVKRDIHGRLDKVCPPHTILSSNSSHLLVSHIESAVERGDRFAALHTHLGSPLVDIVAGPRTDAAVIDILERYVLSTNGVPLVLRKEYPGYVLNAMLGPVLGAALTLVTSGIASREDIDRAWMRHRNAPIGPFGMMDQFGLNLIYDSWKYRDGGDARIERLRPGVIEWLQPWIDRGELGIRSGRGFYQYPDPAYQQAAFLESGEDLSRFYQPLLVALVANGILIAASDVADAEDIDRAWKVGTWLDTGPFEILEQTGERVFLELLAVEVDAGRFSPEEVPRIQSWLMHETTRD